MKSCILFLLLLVVALPARAEEPYPLEKCMTDWKLLMALSDEEARTVCECVENEKKRSPLDAEKGSTLAGPSGLDNAGPWPSIMQNCLFMRQSPASKEKQNNNAE